MSNVENIRKPSLYIAIPTCRDWKSGFATSMIALTSKLTSDYYKGKIEGLHVNNQVSSLLPWGRQLMINDALSTDNFTHILFIDDDTKFQCEAVDSLLSRKLPFVAANMCRKIMEDTGIASGIDGKAIDSTGRVGVEEVAHAGLGMALLEVSMLRQIDAPHFEIIWQPEQKIYLGEDSYFCEKVRQAGFKVHIDHDASNMVGHIGDHAYAFPKLEKVNKEVA